MFSTISPSLVWEVVSLIFKVQTLLYSNKKLLKLDIRSFFFLCKLISRCKIYAQNGVPQFLRVNKRKPYHNVNFIVTHDWFTLYDLVSYNFKVLLELKACLPSLLTMNAESQPFFFFINFFFYFVA